MIYAEMRKKYLGLEAGGKVESSQKQYGGDLPASWNSPVCFLLLGWSPALAYISAGRGINDNWKIPWLLVINVVDRSWKG